MDNNPERVEIEQSFEKLFTFRYYGLIYTFGCINMFLFTLMILTIFGMQKLDFFVVGVCLLLIINIPFIITIRSMERMQRPIDRVKIVIDEKKVEIFLQNQSFKRFLRRDFEKIIVTKESYVLIDRGTKISFHEPYMDEYIRFYVLPLSYKKRKMFLSSLEQFSKYMNKKYIVLPQIEKVNYEEIEKEREDLRKFRQPFKEKAKKKKWIYSSYERYFRRK